ncbi:hypothetical protein KIF24_20255 [Micromonospora sp. Llam7]|uniref:hypothetical protein n=1 Tax=Micromonospora tarapacensis TaxID=2835305 RepID=UPI001C83709E|nr:hypothetical protein [Micromonospora tarapacensis]MBX7268138.1 hypothetical protein [Micromonospora tarapacensis]
MTDPCDFFTTKELETLRLNKGHLIGAGNRDVGSSASAGSSTTCVYFSTISNSREYYLSNVQVTIEKYDDLDRFITVRERVSQREFTRVPERGYYQSQESRPGDIGSHCRIVFVTNASTAVDLDVGVLPSTSREPSKRTCEVVAELAPFIERRIPPQPGA